VIWPAVGSYSLHCVHGASPLARPEPAKSSTFRAKPYSPTLHQMSNLRRAYYSPTAAKLYGSSFYKTADGSEVEVTRVEFSLKDTNTYIWDDAIVVGPVLNYIRKGQRPLLYYS